MCRTSFCCASQVLLTEEERAAQKAKPEKMAIGGDGGFQVLHAFVFPHIHLSPLSISCCAAQPARPDRQPL